MTNKPTAVRKTILITAKPGRHDELRQAMLNLQSQTRLEPGCVSFTFYSALDDAGSFVLVEDFADAQAFDAHLQLPHTKDFFAAQLVAESRAFG
jgi:quinol monooxygenase YgiN